MKTIFKIFIPIAIFLITIWILLFSWTRWPRGEEAGPSSIEKKWTEVSPGNGSELPGLKDIYQSPNSVNRLVISHGSEKIVDVTYQVNDFGIRDDINQDLLKSSHLIASGCSFTFGVSVHYEETFPLYLRRMSPHVNVRNIGFPGGGLHTSLRYLDLVELRSFVPEDKGTFIYVFIPQHISRWNRDLTYLSWAPGHAPAYKGKGSEMKYAGRLENLPEYKTYQFLKMTGVQISKIGRIGYQVGFDKKELNFFMDGLVHLKKRYLTAFPGGRFVWLIHPHSNLSQDKRDGLTEAAMEKGIEIVSAEADYQKYLTAEKISPDEHMIPWDRHPNGKFNHWFAGWVKKNFL